MRIHRWVAITTLALCCLGAASQPEELTYLAGSLSDDEIAELRRSSPNLRVLSGLSENEILEVAAELDGMDARYCSEALLERATRLKWVQSPSAGVERYLALEGLRERDSIVLTNMQGVHGPTIADHAMGMLLMLTRGLDYHAQPEVRGQWRGSVEGVRGGDRERVALEGRTMLVVGLGGIGRAVAQRAKGFGMTVLATRRSDVPPPDYVDRQGKPADLHEFLSLADVVVLCVPLTHETTGLIGEAEFGLMKEGSYLVNVARGKVVNTEALMAALADGTLAGAALDVTDPEPLPADHPLWQMDDVIITPHVSARSELTRKVWRETYLQNLQRFANGQELLNVVDKAAGY